MTIWEIQLRGSVQDLDAELMTQMEQIDPSAKESAIGKDFRGCCRRIALAGWIFAFLVPAIMFFGSWMLDPARFKRKLSVAEMSQATGLTFPEEAECRRFKWIVYFNLEGWIAEIRFPADRTGEICDSVTGMLETSPVPLDGPPGSGNRSRRFGAFATSENWIGRFRSPSESGFAVNAWMATNGQFGTIVLSHDLR